MSVNAKPTIFQFLPQPTPFPLFGTKKIKIKRHLCTAAESIRMVLKVRHDSHEVFAHNLSNQHNFTANREHSKTKTDKQLRTTATIKVS